MHAKVKGHTNVFVSHSGHPGGWRVYQGSEGCVEGWASLRREVGVDGKRGGRRCGRIYGGGGVQADFMICGQQNSQEHLENSTEFHRFRVVFCVPSNESRHVISMVIAWTAVAAAGHFVAGSTTPLCSIPRGSDAHFPPPAQTADRRCRDMHYHKRRRVRSGVPTSMPLLELFDALWPRVLDET